MNVNERTECIVPANLIERDSILCSLALKLAVQYILLAHLHSRISLTLSLSNSRFPSGSKFRYFKENNGEIVHGLVEEYMIPCQKTPGSSPPSQAC